MFWQWWTVELVTVWKTKWRAVYWFQCAADSCSPIHPAGTHSIRTPTTPDNASIYLVRVSGNKCKESCRANVQITCWKQLHCSNSFIYLTSYQTVATASLPRVWCPIDPPTFQTTLQSRTWTGTHCNNTDCNRANRSASEGQTSHWSPHYLK